MVTVVGAGSDVGRVVGSTEEFDEDWRRALDSRDSRYLVFPTWSSARQADVFEWIKVKQVERLLAEAGLRQGRLLEYGCGAAGISLYLAASGHRVHICDLSPYAIKVAKLNQAVRAAGTRIQGAVVANALSLPYADNSFDVVMSYGLLEHFQDDPLNRLIAETVRVLRPGGLYLADIVPGLQRLNARTLGVIASYVGSAAVHILRGQWQALPSLHRRYFEAYYESAHGDTTWRAILQRHNLVEVRVEVCRPFPPLALPPVAERVYADFLRRTLRFHRAFDGANTWLTRRWGWMYLVSGRKR